MLSEEIRPEQVTPFRTLEGRGTLAVVGSTLVPNPRGGGSNPDGDIDHRTAGTQLIPFLFFVRAKMLGKEPPYMATQAYLKVHGGPAPQCAPSSRAVANRGGDGAGLIPRQREDIALCGVWCYFQRVVLCTGT